MDEGCAYGVGLEGVVYPGYDCYYRAGGGAETESREAFYEAGDQSGGEVGGGEEYVEEVEELGSVGWVEDLMVSVVVVAGGGGGVIEEGVDFWVEGWVVEVFVED